MTNLSSGLFPGSIFARRLLATLGCALLAVLVSGCEEGAPTPSAGNSAQTSSGSTSSTGAADAQPGTADGGEDTSANSNASAGGSPENATANSNNANTNGANSNAANSNGADTSTTDTNSTDTGAANTNAGQSDGNAGAANNTAANDAGKNGTDTSDKTATTPAGNVSPLEAKRGANGVYDLTFDDIKFDFEKDGEFKRQMIGPVIESLHGERIRIRGFIYPTTKQHPDNFILVRDNMECCFGPGAAPYDCISVRMPKDNPATYTTRPIAVEGTFSIEIVEYEGMLISIYSMDATSAK